MIIKPLASLARSPAHSGCSVRVYGVDVEQLSLCSEKKVVLTVCMSILTLASSHLFTTPYLREQ